MKKNYFYNILSFVVFGVLIVGGFSYFTFADDTQLTLFEDFDRDGLSNAEEEAIGTNPKEADSDNDGYSDGVEVESGYNPLIPAPGDRIIKERKPTIVPPPQTQTSNVTEKISQDLVSYLADAQENGDTDISSEEFSKVISEAIDKEVSFESAQPIDLSKVRIKKQDYDNLSKKEREEKMKQDAIEYFTAVSYIFVSNFPQGFFDRPFENFEQEFMQHINNYSQSLSQFSFFEEMAEDAINAETQLSDVEVPEDLLDIHTEGLYLLRYMSNIYQSGDYKKANKDITPVIASLAQIQGLIDLTMKFQEKVENKIQEYGIESVFMNI